MEEQKESAEKMEKTKSPLAVTNDMAIEALCKEVWPILVFIGGVDDGLRVGGRCIQTNTQREGVVLGVPKNASNNVRVQWTDTDKTVG